MDFDLSNVDQCGLSERIKEFSYLWVIDDFTPFIPDGLTLKFASNVFNDCLIDGKWHLKLQVQPKASPHWSAIILSKDSNQDCSNIHVSLNFVDKNDKIFCANDSTKLDTLPGTTQIGTVLTKVVKYEIEKHLHSLLWNGNFRILLRMWQPTMQTYSTKPEDIFTPKTIRKPPSTFVQSFEQLFKNANLSDVVIRSESVDIPAHKCVLAARSHVFLTMFEVPMTEALNNIVEIREFPLEVVKGMLKWIYTDNLEMETKKAIMYLQIADLYHLEGLKHEAEVVLARNFNLENALEVFGWSIIYKAMGLKSIVSSFIIKNKKSFVPNPAFLNAVIGNQDVLKEFLELTLK